MSPYLPPTVSPQNTAWNEYGAHGDDTLPGLAWILALAAGIVLGVAHLLSWNLLFPTTDAQLLFRVDTVILLAGPVVVAAASVAMVTLRLPVGYGATHVWIPILMLWATIGYVIYATARVTLVILILYSFRSLPADVYETTSTKWLDFIPFFH